MEIITADYIWIIRHQMIQGPIEGDILNKQQLASKIWKSANKMRSKVEANEYKDYILGFIFYKFLSDKEIELLKSEGWSDGDLKTLSEEDSEIVEYCQDRLGYFIAYKDLFSTWLEMGNEFSVGNVREGLSAFNRLISKSHEKVFKKIFTTLDTGLSKLGDTAGSRTKAINGLIALIRDIPMDGKQGYDVLGFIYEYLIGNFAAESIKKAGEFYTPHEVSVLMSEIVAYHLRTRKKIDIYDPTSGSGSLLINIGKSVSQYIGDRSNVRYYAQELKEATYNLTRMNLVMRGISPDNLFVRNGDTLEEDWPYFDESDPSAYEPLYVDAVVSNPPYSQSWDPCGKESDPRYSRYGVAPKSKADFAFLLHDLYHVKPDGIMMIVLPHGVLFRGGEEERIRRNLIESNNIDAVIGLPPDIFFGTGITTIVMVLKQKRENTDILIIDASKGFKKEDKNRLRTSDIKKIVDTYITRGTEEGYSRAVPVEEVRENGYNLNIPRYVDSSEKVESWDAYSLMFGGIPDQEIAGFDAYWNTFAGLKDALFGTSGKEHSKLLADDVEKAIRENPSVIAWKDSFNKAFGDLPGYLKAELIDKWETIDVDRGENAMTEVLFSKCDSVPLIDRYVAFQAFDDEWTRIASDLETLQTEGLEAARAVDPNMVWKKDKEEQEGWFGRIIPFDLVQSTILKEKSDALKQMDDKLSDIQSRLGELIDTMSEENGDYVLLNDANDAFVSRNVKATIREYFGTDKKADKEVGSHDEGSIEVIAYRARILLDEESELKKEIKTEEKNLDAETVTTIEKLTDDQIYDLLERKWVQPIVDALDGIPDKVITDLASGIRALSDKYASTLVDISGEIERTKNALADMIDDLVGGECDMDALKEFQSLLHGGKNE